MVAAPINYISLDERGVAYITNTKMKVRQIIMETQLWNHTPERIHEGHPHVSLAQIYAALSYYYDHKAQIDDEIARVNEEYEAARAAEKQPLTRQQLEARLKARSGEPTT